MRRIWGIIPAVALATALTSFNNHATPSPVYAAPLASNSAIVSALLPAGTTLGTITPFSDNHRPYALLTTLGIYTNPRPWMVIGRQTAKGQWIPIYAHQTRQAFRAVSTVIGPRDGTQQAITVTFMVDAATALKSTIETMVVSPAGVKLAAVEPDVVAAEAVTETPTSITINGLNFQAKEGFIHGRWRTTLTPLSQLLSHSTYLIRFALGSDTAKTGKSVPSVFIIGPTTIHLTVGQTLSFLPINRAALEHLTGAAGDLGQMTGIDIYGGTSAQQLTLDGVAEVLGNVEKFSQPGSYAFGIAPPGYVSMTPNTQVGVITVNVTK